MDTLDVLRKVTKFYLTDGRVIMDIYHFTPEGVIIGYAHDGILDMKSIRYVSRYTMRVK